MWCLYLFCWNKLCFILKSCSYVIRVSEASASEVNLNKIIYKQQQGNKEWAVYIIIWNIWWLFKRMSVFQQIGNRWPSLSMFPHAVHCRYNPRLQALICILTCYTPAPHAIKYYIGLCNNGTPRVFGADNWIIIDLGDNTVTISHILTSDASEINLHCWRNQRVTRTYRQSSYMFLSIKRNICKSMLHIPAPWHFRI